MNNKTKYLFLIFSLEIIHSFTTNFFQFIFIFYLYIIWYTLFECTGKDWMATWGLADDTTVCVVNLEHAGSPLGM